MGKYVNSDCYVPKSHEVNTEPSMTIEGESFTVREIIEKFNAGLKPAIAKNPFYEDVDNFDMFDFNNPDLDISDIEAEANRLNSMIAEAKAKAEAQKVENAQADVKTS